MIQQAVLAQSTESQVENKNVVAEVALQSLLSPRVALLIVAIEGQVTQRYPSHDIQIGD